MPDYRSEWEFEDPNTRERASKPKAGQTEVASFRISTSHLRMVDVIIQTQHDPRLKTRSDVYQDAVWLWINDWDANYQDSLPGRFQRMLVMENAKNQRLSREKYLTDLDEEIEAAKKSRDASALSGWLANAKAERDDSVGSPLEYLEALEERINALEVMVRKEIPQ